jgi:RNA polymerase sigma-70 factor (ECF subfamily)
VSPFEPAGPIPDEPEASYETVVERYGAALVRLVRAYEANADACRDLLQDVHLAIWRSLARFDRRCSLRTWVYRVAHNTATSHVARAFRLRRRGYVTLDELDDAPDQTAPSVQDTVDRALALERLYELVRRLDPPDRQVMVCYLEGLEAAAIAEIVGLSAGAVSMKIHRAKRTLARQFHGGDAHDD